MKFGRDIHERLKHHIKDLTPHPDFPRWKRLLAWSLWGAVGVLLIIILTIAGISLGLPDVRNFDKLAGGESTIIYDREGGILYSIHGEENRKYVPLSEISTYLQRATIAIEDDQFYEHGGFDIPAIAKSVLHELFGIGARRGGSTITQQLAKNAFLSSQRTYIRKLKELMIAIKLEQTYDKNKILELYLNRIPYGNNAYGIELASKMYFGKSAKDLTLPESVVLASLPQAPTFYSPYGQNVFSKLERDIPPNTPADKLPNSLYDLNETDYVTGLVGKDAVLSPTRMLYIPGRTDIVLRRMTDLGYITEEERKGALNEIHKLTFQKYHDVIKAAHFVFYVRSQLEAQFGKDLVEQGGLQVYTTLDPKLQAAAEQIITAQAKDTKTNFDASSAALLSIDAKTGQILAMVGSADYFDTEAHGNVNHVFAKRQPGSSFKPIMYAKAFLNRYSPATVIYDTPTDFGSGYRPDNYEGLFKGPMSIRKALGQSRNIPALKAYFLAGQQEEIINFASTLGITTLNPKGDYGPPLAIGAGEVTLADMVQAFSVFANIGIKHNEYSILKVIDRQGYTLYERKPEDDLNQEVLDPQVAYLINNILSDKSVYLGPRLDVAGHTTAVKTGTSNKEITPVKILPSNLWTIGYTPSMVTGVWVGNSDGSPMKPSADGYNVAAPIWSKYMSEALKDAANEAFIQPPGIKSVVVSRASGKLPNADAPDYGKVSEVFASFSVPTEVDDMYKQVEINKLDGMLPNEYTPKEFIEKKVFIKHHDPDVSFPRWLDGIRGWVKNERTKNSSFPDFPPTQTTTMFTAAGDTDKPIVKIMSPLAGANVTAGKVPIVLSVDAPHGVSRVLFYLDDRTSPSVIKLKAPYDGSLKFDNRVKPGTHTITVKVYDKLNYVGEAKVEVEFGGTEEPKN